MNVTNFVIADVVPLHKVVNKLSPYLLKKYTNAYMSDVKKEGYTGKVSSYEESTKIKSLVLLTWMYINKYDIDYNLLQTRYREYGINFKEILDMFGLLSEEYESKVGYYNHVFVGLDCKPPEVTVDIDEIRKITFNCIFNTPCCELT